MSANKNDESKTKVAVDTNTDSGFVSEPLDHWPGDDEDAESCGESGVVVDTGEVDCDQLIDVLADVTLVDTSIPVPTHADQLTRCKLSPPEDKGVPAAHLAIFYTPDNEGDTQLHIASVHGCEKSVATLIKICPNKALLDLTNDHGHSPLHLAVMSGNAIVTRMLVRAGLSVDVRDRTGETPLHKATSGGYTECLQALLAPVSDLPTRRLATALNQKNYRGQACVHVAASSGNLETLQTLVYYGADINARENLAGSTALHIAARRGDVRLVQYLRERCAGVQLEAEDYAGRTPRRVARHTAAASLFAADAGSEAESDSDDDTYESDSDETLFVRLRETLAGSTSINVA